jgi:hypothetical protein
MHKRYKRRRHILMQHTAYLFHHHTRLSFLPTQFKEPEDRWRVTSHDVLPKPFHNPSQFLVISRYVPFAVDKTLNKPETKKNNRMPQVSEGGKTWRRQRRAILWILGLKIFFGHLFSGKKKLKLDTVTLIIYSKSSYVDLKLREKESCNEIMQG